MRFVHTEPVIARVYLIIAVSGGVTDPASEGGSFVTIRREWIDSATPSDARNTRIGSRADERAEALVAALTGYALHDDPRPDFDLAKHAERLLELLMPVPPRGCLCWPSALRQRVYVLSCGGNNKAVVIDASRRGRSDNRRLRRPDVQAILTTLVIRTTFRRWMPSRQSLMCFLYIG